jgi:hypothetical protein
MAETAADMPQSYQIFKNDAQETPDKTARHRLAADLLPEIWVQSQFQKSVTDRRSIASGYANSLTGILAAGPGDWSFPILP